MTLNERIEYAKEMQHDVIMVKNGLYVSGSWDEQARAERIGFEFVGSVAQLWNELHKQDTPNDGEKQAGYDAAQVMEAYAEQHPDRRVLYVCKSREAALKAVASAPGRMLDLSYGFYVVTSAPVG